MVARYFLILILLSVGLRSYGQMHDMDSLLAANPAFAGKFEAHQSQFDPFDESHPLDISIVADFKSFNRQKDPENYHAATLQYVINDTIRLSREIGIRARGNHRRETCKYPPIKLNFKKKLAVVDWIKEFDKMKMVGSCQDAASFEQYVLAEYTIYKMLNELTDESFRVRLIRVNYIDTSNDKMKSAERMAFLIEPHQSLGKRINASRVDTPVFALEAYPEPQIRLINTFQYMVGNTDWSIPALHNIAVFKPNDVSKFTPTAVAYDFDMSGIINSPYAVPNESLGIANVRTRLFRGLCGSVDEYSNEVELFLSKKEILYGTISESQFLTDQMKSSMTKYLDSFYATLTDEKRWERVVMTNCK